MVVQDKREKLLTPLKFLSRKRKNNPGTVMQNKILFIGWWKDWSKEIADPSTVLVGTGFDCGTNSIEYEFYDHLAAHKVIEKTVTAEKDGFHAVVIGCFYDPGLQEAKELVQMPVIGVCEASLHVASMISAGKYSVLVGRRKWIPKLADNARHYGLDSRIASWRAINLTVEKINMDREKAEAALIREARRAVEEDLAECIILGCTQMAGYAKKIENELKVPVLNPVLIGVKVAELRATLWQRFNISQSKIGGYEAPPLKEFATIYKKVYGNTPKK
jgi:allantoin racemase